MNKLLLTSLVVLIAVVGQNSTAQAQYEGGFYPVHDNEKLTTIEGTFKNFALARAGGGVTIDVHGQEKFYEASKFLTVERKLNKCLDSPVPEFNITCKTWPKNIKPNTVVRVTYWVMIPQGMHEDGIVTDISAVHH